MASRRKPATVALAGITFHPCREIQWEDAYKATKVPAKIILGQLSKGKGQATAFSCGWYAKIHGHLVICHEFNLANEEGDFTVVPLKAKVEIKK